MSHRFLYQNRVSASTAITPSSTAAGAVSGGFPRVAQGSGVVVFSGAYTGAAPSLFTVAIETDGNAGVATFKWRKSATAPGTWEASGVLTTASDQLLGDGVSVRFTNGSTSPSFKAGDRWQAPAARFRSAGALFDLDPNTVHRTGGTAPADPETIVFDLGAAQEVKAAVLHLHNITSAAAVKIQGNTADSWAAPALEETFSWRAGTMIHYIAAATKTYRYWRLVISGEAGNPDGWIEIAEVYLGDYFEPAVDFLFRNVVGDEPVGLRQRTEAGAEKLILLGRARRAALPYAHVPEAQRALFEAAFRAVKDPAAGRDLPLFVHLDVDDAGSLFLMHIEREFAPSQEGPDDFSFTLELRERTP